MSGGLRKNKVFVVNILNIFLFVVLALSPSMYAASEPATAASESLRKRRVDEVHEMIAFATPLFTDPVFAVGKHTDLPHHNLYYLKLIRRLPETLEKPEALKEIVHFLDITKELLTGAGKEWLLGIYKKLEHLPLSSDPSFVRIRTFLLTPTIPAVGIHLSSVVPVVAAGGASSLFVAPASPGGAGAVAAVRKGLPPLRVETSFPAHFSARDFDVDRGPVSIHHNGETGDDGAALKIIKGLVPLIEKAKREARGTEKEYLAAQLMPFLEAMIPTSSYRKPAFWRALRDYLVTSLGHGLAKPTDVDGLYLYLLGLLRNVIQKRLLQLEGELSPTGTLRGTLITPMTTAERPGPLKEILFLEERLSQKDDPRDGNSCTLFAVYHALCFVAAQEGITDEPGLSFINKEKYDALYRDYWIRIIVSYGRDMDNPYVRTSVDEMVEAIKCGEPLAIVGGIPAEIIHHLCKQIIDGKGGITSPLLRDAFKRRVVNISEMHQKQDSYTSVLDRYKAWRKEASGSPFADAQAIEDFRHGRAPYLVVLHSNAYDSHIGFSEAYQSPHATTWCVERMRDVTNASRVVIADSDISHPGREYIKYVYNAIFANLDLDRD